MTFHKINEDPMYDDDGNCVDEDLPPDDSQDIIDYLNEELADSDEIYGPYVTVNS